MIERIYKYLNQGALVRSGLWPTVHAGEILLWYDDPSTLEHLQREVIRQTVRLKATVDRGDQAPRTLAEAAKQQAKAGALAGDYGAFSQIASNILAERADETSLSTMVSFLYGDEAAATMGYSPIGLDGRTGYEHAVHAFS